MADVVEHENSHTFFNDGVRPALIKLDPGLFQCPFCHKKGEYPGLTAHLQSHNKSAVNCGGYNVYKCHLGCMPNSHYHCGLCPRTYTRKDSFMKHFQTCCMNTTTVLMEVTTPEVTMTAPLTDTVVMEVTAAAETEVTTTTETIPASTEAMTSSVPGTELSPVNTVTVVTSKSTVAPASVQKMSRASKVLQPKRKTTTCCFCDTKLLKKNLRTHIQRHHNMDGSTAQCGEWDAVEMAGCAPSIAMEAVLKPSCDLPEDMTEIKGYDFNQGVDLHKVLKSYISTGFQASSLGLAIQEINHMIEKRLEPVEADEGADSAESTNTTGCTIFLGYTSNLISSGVRESIRYLVEHKMVDVIVTTAGGIEEDFIKCLAHTYLGDFSMSGKELRLRGINRIGNLLVPNDNYCKFEDWLMPILDQMLLEQTTEGIRWTPSKMIHRLGKEINNPESVYYWAYKNNIPVFSPALTDGSLGDMLYFHSFKNPGMVLDIVEDIRKMNSQAVFAKKTGMIILGGGLVKHHIANANLMRNGADYAVFVNTGQEFDGSDSGARPDEAISWGKIRTDAKPVKVYADASLVFPLIVAETFALHADKFTTAKNTE